MKKIAFYGGSFDPIHNGHLAIAQTLTKLFALDEFYFLPAFHAPHKRDKKMSSAFCRYAMLALATNDEPQIKISTIELEAPEKPYTIETLTKLKNHYGELANIFFVMGADSWNEIDTWREYQKLLLLTNFIVVTRPGNEIATNHISPEIRARMIDARGLSAEEISEKLKSKGVFFTDAVFLDIASTVVRREISLQNSEIWRKLVTESVAEYIEKYKLYR